MWRIAGVMVVLGPVAVAVPLALAAPPAADPASIVTLQIENDAVSTYRGTSDFYYTSGLRLGYVSPTTAVPAFLAEFGRNIWGDGTQRISVNLSQSIFSPRNTQARFPDPRDRPYAGYLHADAALIHDTADTRTPGDAPAGMTGSTLTRCRRTSSRDGHTTGSPLRNRRLTGLATGAYTFRILRPFWNL